jgi:NDP-sugar pyrophosphorylase family protein
MPFGELHLDGTRVTAYTEKPITKSLVCSAICVAGPAALAAIPADQATGLSELARQLIQAGNVVEAFPHEAAWIDVNDVASIARAEQLMRDCGDQFAWFSDDGPSEPAEAA